MIVLGRIVAPYGVKGWVKVYQRAFRLVGERLVHGAACSRAAGEPVVVEDQDGPGNQARVDPVDAVRDASVEIHVDMGPGDPGELCGTKRVRNEPRMETDPRVGRQQLRHRLERSAAEVAGYEALFLVRTRRHPLEGIEEVQLLVGADQRSSREQSRAAPEHPALDAVAVEATCLLEGLPEDIRGVPREQGVRTDRLIRLLEGRLAEPGGIERAIEVHVGDPLAAGRKVKAVPGVTAVTPILYLSNYVVMGEERNLAYIIGLPEKAEFGGAWKVSSGRSLPGKGEAVIDRKVAEKSGVTLGDEIEILGEEFEVVGLSEETSSLVNSVAFISMKDFEELRGSYETFSFLLAKVEAGESPEVVAARIQAWVRDVTVQTREDFASQERQVVKDMSTDVITIMNLIGFLIGLAVMALTVYTATLARRAEFGVLKALGAGRCRVCGRGLRPLGFRS